jgi:hypothetical protein
MLCFILLGKDRSKTDSPLGSGRRRSFGSYTYSFKYTYYCFIMH